MNRVAQALLLVIVATQAFIDLQLRLDLPFWKLDAPVADLAGALLVVVVLPVLLLTARDRRPPAPAPWAAAAFGAIALLAAAFAPLDAYGPAAAIKDWLRHPVFLYVAYAITLPWALQRTPWRVVRPVLWWVAGAVAVVSIATSVVRFGTGLGLWWSAVEGLTPNHKTLAVWLAPWLAWLWHHRERTEVKAILVAVVAAIALSASKTAIVTGGFALAWSIHAAGSPLVTRWKATAAVAVVVAGVGLAVPAFLGSPTVLAELEQRTPLGIRARMMLDAARSRQSLNQRAWEMVASRPILGYGPGASTRYEMVEFPHYRINGVDAHGVVPKVTAETGLAGLGAFAVFTVVGGIALRRRWSGDTTDPTWAWLGVAAALHVNLLFSTETFTMTHWVPLGLAWAAAHRDDLGAA